MRQLEDDSSSDPVGRYPVLRGVHPVDQHRVLPAGAQDEAVGGVENEDRLTGHVAGLQRP